MRRTINSPWGKLALEASANGLRAIHFGAQPDDDGPGAGFLDQTEAELRAYARDPALRFAVPLDLHGTEFQLRVWRLLLEIPAGVMATYGELARKLGKPGASRAVGLANGANPIPIIVPCHRVVGSDGSLTGYGGGLELKRALLRHEERVLVLR